MISLKDLLAQKSHRDLELTARAYRLTFTRRESKSQGLAQLSDSLLNGAYQKAYQALESEHIEALHALIIGGGYLPLILFEAHFGIIRPYRPWRKDFYPRHPWRYPISLAERLFHLGFIHIRDKEMVGIVQEVAMSLPDLPRAEAIEIGEKHHSSTTQPTRIDLLRDMSAFLGTLMQSQSKAVHGRWLSLTDMRFINKRLTIREEGLKQGEEAKIRSELQTGRLRWLHYLAQVGGLLSIQNGIFTPTMSAWQWLSASVDMQWDSLMAAIEADLDSRQPLWDTFRFPEIERMTWQVLRHTLDDLSPAKSYRIKDVLAMLKPYLLSDSYYAIACLLRDQFAWSGQLVLSRGRLFVHSSSTQHLNHSPTTLKIVTDLSGIIEAIHLPLPETASVALSTLLSFADTTDNCAIITAENLCEAYRQGLDVVTIVDTLQNLSGETVPASIQTVLSEWMQSAQAITLKPMLILHAPDSESIDRIRGDWRLAKFFSQRLSANHLAIHAHERDKFLQALARRDIQLTSFIAPQEKRRITDELNPDMAEYLYLALRTYQKLQSRLGASIPIPKALTHWLSSQIEDAESIEINADELVQAVHKRIPQQHPVADVSQQDEIHIRHMIYTAHQQQRAITLDYHSPYLDETSTRTLNIHAISESNDLIYIDAHCHLVGERRTFRLDRIQRIHEERVAVS